MQTLDGIKNDYHTGICGNATHQLEKIRACTARFLNRTMHLLMLTALAVAGPAPKNFLLIAIDDLRPSKLRGVLECDTRLLMCPKLKRLINATPCPHTKAGYE